MQLRETSRYPFIAERIQFVGVAILLQLASVALAQDTIAPNASDVAVNGRLATANRVIDLQADNVTEMVTIGKTEFRHSAFITSIAFVPDQPWVVTTARDATARVWDLETGRQLRRFYLDSNNDAVWHAVVDARGQELFTCNSAGNVTRWDLATGEKLAVYDTTVRVFRMALFPDGKRFIVVGNSGYAAIWDIETGKQMKRLRPQSGDLYGVDVDPEGKRIVTCGEPGSVVWSAEDGSQLLELKSGDDDVFTAKFSPDGTRIASCDAKGAVRIYNATVEKPVWQERYGSDAKVVDWSSDGSRLAISVPQSGVTIIDSRDGAQIKAFKRAQATYWPVLFSLDAKQIYAGDGRELVCWEIESGRQLLAAKSPLLPGGSLRSLAITSDLQQVLLKEGTSRIYKWDLKQGKLSVVQQSNRWRHIAASADGQFLAICHAAGVSETSEATDEDDLETQELIELIEEATEIEFDEELQPEDEPRKKELEFREAVVHEVFMARKIEHEHQVRVSVLRTDDFSEQATIALDVGASESMQFIDGERLLLVHLTGQHLQIWDAAAGELYWDFKVPGIPFKKLMAGDSSPYFILEYEKDEWPVVFDGVRRKLLGELPFKMKDVADCLFLPDRRGMVIASKVDGQSIVTFWKGRLSDEIEHLRDAELAKVLELVDDEDYEKREYATQKLIDQGTGILEQLAAGDRSSPEFCWRIKYIEAEIERAALPRTAAAGKITTSRPVYSITVHPDGKHIAFVAGNDANAEICLAGISEEGLELQRSIISGHSPKQLKFSYDGSMLLVDNNDGTVSVFRCQ